MYMTLSTIYFDPRLVEVLTFAKAAALAAA